MPATVISNTSDTMQVLVLSHGGAIAKECLRLCKENGLSGQEILLSSSSLEQKLQEFTQRPVYKLVLIDLKQGFEPSIKNALDFAKSQNWPTLYIGHWRSDYGADKQLQLLDLIAKNKESSGERIASLFSSKTATITDPQTRLYPLVEESVFPLLPELLFSPNASPERIVSGRAVFSSSLLSFLPSNYSVSPENPGKKTAIQVPEKLLEQLLVEAKLLEERLIQLVRSNVTEQVTPKKVIPPKSPEPVKKTSKKPEEKVSFEAEVKELFRVEQREEKQEKAQKKLKKGKKIVKKNKRKKTLLFFSSLVLGISAAMLCLLEIFYFSFSQLENENWRSFFNWQYRAVKPLLSEKTIKNIDSRLQEIDQEKVVEEQKNIVLESASGLFQAVFNQNKGSAGLISSLQSNFSSHTSLIDDNELKSLAPLVEALPSLLGVEGKKTYLLLVQNEHELRPSGGLIESVVFLSIENGRLIDSKVFDIFTLERALKGEVEAPEDFQAIRKLDSLPLREANWSLDFPQSAEAIKKQLSSGLGIKIDGVITLNLQSLSEIIRALGPIALEENKEVVTAGNLNEKAFSHYELQLVERLDSSLFLTELSRAILEKLQTLSEAQVQELLLALGKELDSQNILFASEALPPSLSWSGKLLSPRCPGGGEESCYIDYFSLFESNVGVNKANHEVEREMSHLATLEDGYIKHLRTVVIRNTANKEVGQKYHSYIRFLLPSSARLESVRINQKKLDSQEIIFGQSQDKREYGLEFELEPSSLISLQIEYRNLISSLPDQYGFFEQAQPGVSYPLRLRVQYPPEKEPKLLAPKAQIDGSEAAFSEIINNNVLFTIKF